jgi:hypothetical protein
MQERRIEDSVMTALAEILPLVPAILLGLTLRKTSYVLSILLASLCIARAVLAWKRPTDERGRIRGSLSFLLLVGVALCALALFVLALVSART